MGCRMTTADGVGYVAGRGKLLVAHGLEKVRVGVGVPAESPLLVAWSFHAVAYRCDPQIPIGDMSDRETTKCYQIQ